MDRTSREGIQKATLDKIKRLNQWEPERKFTQFELKQVPGFTGNTLRALFRKGIIDIVKDAPIDGPEYYQWTGKEL